MKTRIVLTDEDVRPTTEVLLVNYANDRDLPWVVDPEGFRQRVAAEERGYRRGFWHGYSHAMDDALDAGAKKGSWWFTLARFFDSRITRWYHGDISTRESPPELRKQR